MADDCCQAASGSARALNDPRWRRALWIALGLNAVMFAFEMTAGARSDSRSLQADALDFFGDSANYAISLGVAGMALAWRARAALVKGGTMLAFGLWVLGSAIYATLQGAAPQPETMGAVGLLALAVNLGVAVLLYSFRTGDANMRSVWICSRNDAIGNVAVIMAAIGVFGTGSAWPDLIVAVLFAALAINGGWSVARQSIREMREAAFLEGQR